MYELYVYVCAHRCVPASVGAVCCVPSRLALALALPHRPLGRGHAGEGAYEFGESRKPGKEEWVGPSHLEEPVQHVGGRQRGLEALDLTLDNGGGGRRGAHRYVCKCLSPVSHSVVRGPTQHVTGMGRPGPQAAGPGCGEQAAFSQLLPSTVPRPAASRVPSSGASLRSPARPHGGPC